MINFSITGRIGKDAKASLVNGRQVVTFSVASDKKYKNKNGELKTITTWVRMSYWTDNQNIIKYLTKGAVVAVSGDISASSYTNSNGETMSYLDCTVAQIEIVNFANNGGGQGNQIDRQQTKQIQRSSNDDLNF